MRLGESIWQELGALASVVELIDHENGTVRFKENASQIDRNSVADIIAAHNPLSESVSQVELKAQQQLRLEAKAMAMFDALKNATLSQINTWIDSNFNGMSVQQRAFLKMVAAGVSLYLRER